MAKKNEYIILECMVAAILANAATDEKAHSATYMVNKYRAMLNEIRETGGLLEEGPRQKPREPST